MMSFLRWSKSVTSQTYGLNSMPQHLERSALGCEYFWKAQTSWCKEVNAVL